MKKTNIAIQTSHLSVGYEGKKNSDKKIILEKINLSLEKGKLTCLLGPNGSGKSTLMRSLAGLQMPLSGKVMLNEKDILSFSGEEMAKQLSMVLTDRIDVAYITVKDVVKLGRTPYTNWFGVLTEYDYQKIEWALNATGIKLLEHQKIIELSDGQRQKALIARALAQDTAIIILDEPTAHLDLPNRLELMQLLHDLAKNTNKAILVSTHELDLAIQMADLLWLIGQDQTISEGLPEELVINGMLEAAFIKDGIQFDKTSGQFLLQKSPNYGTISISGHPLAVQWCSRAFEKIGINTIQSQENGQILAIQKVDGQFCWELKTTASTYKFTSMSSLLSKVKDMLDNQ